MQGWWDQQLPYRKKLEEERKGKERGTYRKELKNKQTYAMVKPRGSRKVKIFLAPSLLSYYLPSKSQNISVKEAKSYKTFCGSATLFVHPADY